jgi:hypothetical protein
MSRLSLGAVLNCQLSPKHTLYDQPVYVVNGKSQVGNLGNRQGDARKTDQPEFNLTI